MGLRRQMYIPCASCVVRRRTRFGGIRGRNGPERGERGEGDAPDRRIRRGADGARGNRGCNGWWIVRSRREGCLFPGWKFPHPGQVSTLFVVLQMTMNKCSHLSEGNSICGFSDGVVVEGNFSCGFSDGVVVEGNLLICSICPGGRRFARRCDSVGKGLLVRGRLIALRCLSRAL